jgi:hypothetical protein
MELDTVGRNSHFGSWVRDREQSIAEPAATGSTYLCLAAPCTGVVKVAAAVFPSRKITAVRWKERKTSRMAVLGPDTPTLGALMPTAISISKTGGWATTR